MGEVDLNTLASSAMTKQQSLWFFQQPILYSALEVDDFLLRTPFAKTLFEKKEPRLGTDFCQWIATTGEAAPHSFTGIFIGSLGFLAIAILMAIRLGRGITTPLSQLSNTVQQLESGNLSARAPELNGKEFRILPRGSIAWPSALNMSTKNYNNALPATKQLTQTLDDLEQQNHALSKPKMISLRQIFRKATSFARMSHELRTPLTSIMGYSELLEDMGLAEQQRNLIKLLSSHPTYSFLSSMIFWFHQTSSQRNWTGNAPFNLKTAWKMWWRCTPIMPLQKV